MLKKFVACVLLVLSTSTMAAAASLSYDFAFMGSESGSGTLTLSDTINAFGGYDITGISGQFGGNTITGLVPVDPASPFPSKIVVGGFEYTYDNILYPAQPIKLDEFGLAFYAGGSFYNIFDAVAYDPPANNPYGLFIDQDNIRFGNLLLTQNSNVPETSTWAMLIVGFGMMGGSIRYARKARPPLSA